MTPPTPPTPHTPIPPTRALRPLSALVTMLAICAFGAPALGGENETSACIELPAVLPNPGSQTFDLEIPPINATIDSVGVITTIDTEWVGDLTIDLEHNGTTVRVLDTVAAQGTSFGCGGNNINAWFTDSSSTTADSLCSNTTDPMLDGLVLSDEPLDTFVGGNPGGTWSITINDQYAYDEATVQLLCITINYTPAPPACDGDANGDNLVDVNDISYVLFRLGDSGTPGAVDGDANQDGTVDVNDISYVLFRLGNC